MPEPCPDRSLAAVRLVAMDVDGVLTDGGLFLGADVHGSLLEVKQFNVRDGLGIGLLRAAGIPVAWITGRTSPIVTARAAELGVDEVCQWARNKRASLEELSARLKLGREEILYIGDDLNDLPAFAAAGVRVAVADAASALRERADWVTTAPGGKGALREVADTLLRAQGRWDTALEAFLARLAQEHSSNDQ